MYCSGKREIKNNRVCFFHNTTRTHRWRERERERVEARASEEMQREEKKKRLSIFEAFLLLSSENTRILRSDSSFAFTALQTNNKSKLMPPNRLLRHGYWLMNAEAKFKRRHLIVKMGSC